ncbi:hypothetical protein LPN01_10290 [Sphingomonas sp. A2-49]|uniref:hypothetical protein n=1 Tax=Sphingomonas sp. A2-49 TaxID=1391375 RepID=UPI0021D16696|nr:hypothetical protein [Sphingomonas sp. A2-49]MCU6454464.1 hypothetical protein [Sphingomonas sp. A2-49]
MSSDATFFRKQADQERSNAADATLDNVRDRCERAARSWEAMASRAERTEVMRDQRAAATRAAATLATVQTEA